METAQADAGGGTPPPECCPGAWMRRPAKALSTLHRRDTGPGRRSGPETPKPPQTRSLAIPVSPRPAEGAWSPRRWRGRPHQTSGWNAARYLTGEMGLFRDSSAWPSGSQRAGLEHSFSVGGKAAVSREPIRRRWDCKCAGFSLAGLLLGREKIFLPAAGAAAPVPGLAVGSGRPTPPEWFPSVRTGMWGSVPWPRHWGTRWGEQRCQRPPWASSRCPH